MKPVDWVAYERCPVCFRAWSCVAKTPKFVELKKPHKGRKLK